MASVPSSTQQSEYVPLPDDMNVDDTQVPLAGVDYPWDGEAIPSYDAPISPVREPTPGSTSPSRTPAPQSNWRRSAAAVQPLEPMELVQSLISAFTAQGASHTSGSNDDTSDPVVQFKEKEQAALTLQSLQGRFYSGSPILADFSPVIDFCEATCRQFEENSCNRGNYCNFVHMKQIGRVLKKKLFDRDHGDYHGSGRINTDRSADRYDRHDSNYDRRRRTSSPIREGREERRARIEQ
ncbi:hypothetical protein GIB67_019621 [Kingdonia uniflora]|uniref:C3H1-type domain-containing protein n=1 Tax=Kingdonia uniflora TaxID=39325 RepID=A0A7J7N0F6_9MAGN|nr:hypothetical protein GIB67_019621 [Kingdonia uniflora]